MNTQLLVFLAIVFTVTAAVSALAVWIMYPDRLRKRLAHLEVEADSASKTSLRAWFDRIAHVVQPLARLSLPSEGWEGSAMRLRFINAGWRSSSAPVIFFAGKTVMALLLPLLVLLAGGEPLLSSGGNMILLILVLAAFIGYYAPNALLNRVIEKRQREIFENFPDALDLLIICIEAGLSLDQAIAKVAREIELKSHALAQEFQLVMIELRNGFSKEAALRHLALRTGVEDIDLLVAMLIQAERFGTSMGDSLRVHAENLRTKRRQRAEEAAAKIAVKLLVPLIFMIFPTLLMILMGPAIIQIYRVLMPAIAPA